MNIMLIIIVETWKYSLGTYVDYWSADLYLRNLSAFNASSEAKINMNDVFDKKKKNKTMEWLM